jgi:hypothetical protein
MPLNEKDLKTLVPTVELSSLANKQLRLIQTTNSNMRLYTNLTIITPTFN